MDHHQIVIVENNKKLQVMLSEYFESQQFKVTTVDNGLDATDVILQLQPDIVLLDLMLPGQDGLSVCRQIRNCYLGKILMLTASDDDFDHVVALELGADDFITKPVKPRVLLARIRMLLRRSFSLTSPDKDLRKFGELHLNKRRKECILCNHNITLTDGEFDLLWLLALYPESTLSREWLTKTLRGIEYDGSDRTIDNRIMTLRKKLGDISTPPQKIITIRNKGYLFLPDAWT